MAIEAIRYFYEIKIGLLYYSEVHKSRPNVAIFYFIVAVHIFY